MNRSAAVVKPMVLDAEKQGKAWVHLTSFRETYTGLVEQAFLDQMSLDRLTQVAYEHPENTLVAVLDGQVVGFAAYGPDRSNIDSGEIYALYVLADYQGQGIGTHLLEVALEQLKPSETVVIWALEVNSRAITFYEQQGFQLSGNRRTVTMGSELPTVQLVKTVTVNN